MNNSNNLAPTGQILGGLITTYFKRKEVLPKKINFIIDNFLDSKHNKINGYALSKKNNETKKITVGYKINTKEIILFNNECEYMNLISDDFSIILTVKKNSEFMFSKLGKTAKIIEIKTNENCIISLMNLGQYKIKILKIKNCRNKSIIKINCNTIGEIIVLANDDNLFMNLFEFLIKKNAQIVNDFTSILYCAFKSNDECYNKLCECKGCCSICCSNKKCNNCLSSVLINNIKLSYKQILKLISCEIIEIIINKKMYCLYLITKIFQLFQQKECCCIDDNKLTFYCLYKQISKKINSLNEKLDEDHKLQLVPENFFPVNKINEKLIVKLKHRKNNLYNQLWKAIKNRNSTTNINNCGFIFDGITPISLNSFGIGVIKEIVKWLGGQNMTNESEVLFVDCITELFMNINEKEEVFFEASLESLKEICVCLSHYETKICNIVICLLLGYTCDKYDCLTTSSQICK